MRPGVTAAPELDETPASVDGETAFTRAYDTEHPRVFGYIRSRVPDGSTADDLTAQTFLKALDRLDTYDPDRAPMSAWLLAIARNVVRDHLRAQRRWGWLPFDWLRDRPSGEPSPEHRLLQAEQQSELIGALSRLTGRERDILGLRFYGGLTSPEIAHLTGLREGNVRVIVYRAIGRLRDVLASKEVRRG